jgi:hypothetical protein
MHYRLKFLRWLFLAFAEISLQAGAQQPVKPILSTAFFDSIDHRIDYLQKQIERYKQVRDVAYLNFQRELDHTLFLKTYEQFVVNEDLDQAKDLVESRLKKSEFRRDQASVSYYNQYQENTYNLIKLQKMHYQALFLKEKSFKKEFDSWIAAGTLESYKRAQRMVNLATKYARENDLAETLKMLEEYDFYTQALIFDIQSGYDLAVLTNNSKSFEKVFQPMLASDSLKDMKEAEQLLSYCRNYGKLTASSLNGEYFKKQESLLTSALSDLLEKQGREKELAKYTDQSVVAKFDSLNPCGVFKWHDQIVVIDEFNPSSAMDHVKKGEAIIHADKMLSTYLQKNKLCTSINDLRFGYAFIIPFQSNAENTSFFYNKSSDKWQYIACYTVITNKTYTAEISKFMPPLYFQDEMNTAEK